MRSSSAGVRLHVVSRHGLLPLPHAAETSLLPPADVPESVTFEQARRLVFTRIRATGGDWRAAVDGLRPVTNALWAALTDADRQRFLAFGARRWDRARHRVDPEVHAWLEQRRADGTLVVHAGTVTAARERAGGVEVTLSDGSQLTAAAVVNCTGVASNLRTSADPLVTNLIAAGTLRPDRLDLGADATPDGRVSRELAVWTIGPLRRGALWETTAIPEIRCQAASLAESVIATLPRYSPNRRALVPA
jgi:uncharacterized NAD(P)/FAD-binding protein YdhS